MIYMIIGILFLCFIIYVRYQIKIKNNKNYPVIWAMTLGSLTFFGNMNIKWIIENLNRLAGTELSIPEKISYIELAIFLFFLYGSIVLYYRFVFDKNQQKNTIFSFFIKGNIKQKNKSKK